MWLVFEASINCILRTLDLDFANIKFLSFSACRRIFSTSLCQLKWDSIKQCWDFRKSIYSSCFPLNFEKDWKYSFLIGHGIYIKYPNVFDLKVDGLWKRIFRDVELSMLCLFFKFIRVIVDSSLFFLGGITKRLE